MSESAERVTGANATLDIIPSARAAAVGGAGLPILGDPTSLIENAWQLAHERYMSGSFSHVSYFEGTTYDLASMALPLGGAHGVGFSFARFGANDIPWIREGDPIPEGNDYKTIHMADWLFSIAYGRTLFKNLDFGVSLHGLFREMDQTGFGFRGDANLRYAFPGEFSLAMLLKGWTSSAVRWESGTFEYEAPELYLGASWGKPVRYFYGKFLAYWQSAGIFHREARALDWDGSSRGDRLIDSPFEWLQGSRGGVEFSFDFGLSLRAGLSSFTTWESFTAGAGITISKFLKVDYAFESHPVLSSVHRVSISISPKLFMASPSTLEDFSSIEGEENFSSESEFSENSLSENVSENLSENLSENPNQSIENSLQESSPEKKASPKESDEEILEEPSGGFSWEE